MITYQQLQSQRDEYQKQARIYKRKGQIELAQKANSEVKALNKQLRKLHNQNLHGRAKKNL